MKLLILLAALSLATQAAEPFPIPSGNGVAILSPIDTTMVEVKDGAQRVRVPSGMVYVPAGKFRFGESETRELPAYAIARFEVTNAEYKAFADATRHRGVPRYWQSLRRHA